MNEDFRIKRISLGHYTFRRPLRHHAEGSFALGEEGAGKGVRVIHRVVLSLRGIRMGTPLEGLPYGDTNSIPLPIPEVLCQTSAMRNLTATICLTLVVLLGSTRGRGNDY